MDQQQQQITTQYQHRRTGGAEQRKTWFPWGLGPYTASFASPKRRGAPRHPDFVIPILSFRYTKFQQILYSVWAQQFFWTNFSMARKNGEKNGTHKFFCWMDQQQQQITTQFFFLNQWDTNKWSGRKSRAEKPEEGTRRTGRAQPENQRNRQKKTPRKKKERGRGKKEEEKTERETEANQDLIYYPFFFLEGSLFWAACLLLWFVGRKFLKIGQFFGDHFFLSSSWTLVKLAQNNLHWQCLDNNIVLIVSNLTRLTTTKFKNKCWKSCCWRPTTKTFNLFKFILGINNLLVGVTCELVSPNSLPLRFLNPPNFLLAPLSVFVGHQLNKKKLAPRPCRCSLVVWH